MRPKSASPLVVLTALALLGLGCDLWDQNTSPVAPEGTLLTIRANPTTISLFGESRITIVATHESGVPARTGTEIRISSDLGTLDDPLVTTDSRGMAETMLRGDGIAGTANVRATSGAIGGSATQVSVTIGTAVLAAMFEAEIGESLTVGFKDGSTGDPTEWEWDFGDDSTPAYRTTPDPVHTYPEAGTYLVSLTVRNPNGQDAVSDFITVPASGGSAPVANFSAAVDDLTVTFTDTSTNNPTRWEWDFGDGSRPSYRTAQDPTHTYREAGTYTVRLTAGNATGETSIGKSVTVP